MSTHTIQSKTEILKAFQSLRQQYEQDKTQMMTKSEVAEKQKQKALVKQASKTTVTAIVNDVAGLQLNFNEVLETLSKKLENETTKLQDLRQAIQVEQQTLEQLKQVKVSAETLDILVYEHQQTLAQLSQDHQSALQNLSKQQQQIEAQWQQQAQDFEQENIEYEANKTKARQQAEEEYSYDYQRKVKLAEDKYKEDKRLLERQLNQSNAEKQKDWQQREQQLAEQADELVALQQKVAQAPEKLKQEANKAREKAIQKIHNDAKVELELLSKDNQASIEVYELKVRSLEADIQEQAQQIDDLSKQLNHALQQVQALAANAVSGK